MPRDGSGIYTKPFPDVVEGTTIESSVHNGTVSDVETDLNAPRPVVAGGTGATNAAEARANLQAEVAGQVVSNYDSHVWKNGSFVSYGAATAAPLGGHSFTGSCVVLAEPQQYITVEARSNTDGISYCRLKVAGVWGAWFREADDKVSKAGDIMTGDLTIRKDAGPTIFLNRPIPANPATIYGQANDFMRWSIHPGAGAETGSNGGSDFWIARYNDAGTSIDIPLQIVRSSGTVAMPTVSIGTSLNIGNAALIAAEKLGLKFDGTVNNVIATYDTNVVAGAGTVMLYYRAGAAVGAITTSLTATQYNTTSDIRLKEDAQPFTRAREIVDGIAIKDFKWKNADARSVGLFAKDAYEVFKDAVTPPSDLPGGDMWMVDYSKFVPVLIADAQETHARVASLEAQVATLMARIEVLEAAQASP